MELLFFSIPLLAMLIFGIVFLFVFGSILARLFRGRGTVDRVLDMAEDQVRRNHEQRFGSRRRVRPSERGTPPSLPHREAGAMDFQCDHCGATAEGPMDISPSGDVRCTYCGKWYNVR
jgi:DNA-directed RNA polymerase subunit RPC12/RpoP